jgi:hypothetical protein
LSSCQQKEGKTSKKACGVYKTWEKERDCIYWCSECEAGLCLDGCFKTCHTNLKFNPVASIAHTQCKLVNPSFLKISVSYIVQKLGKINYFRAKIKWEFKKKYYHRILTTVVFKCLC